MSEIVVQRCHIKLHLQIQLLHHLMRGCFAFTGGPESHSCAAQDASQALVLSHPIASSSVSSVRLCVRVCYTFLVHGRRGSHYRSACIQYRCLHTCLQPTHGLCSDGQICIQPSTSGSLPTDCVRAYLI